MITSQIDQHGVIFLSLISWRRKHKDGMTETGNKMNKQKIV